ncbi:hypothetical protein ACO22_07644 [Paracoccidioides brasiliensis]|uniref:Methyltransferase domain-containing protein n=1 Tax=Paracoccidioides brasiliensis TaxID=121759 RepID=A0A1D2J4I0_PARBR|nr:hypothetical protein ACO22_07644 [Paracoccidioides brasiliensis]
MVSPASTKPSPKYGGRRKPTEAMRTKGILSPLPVVPSHRTRPTQSTTAQALPRTRSINPKVLTACAVAVFCFSAYGSYLYVTYDKSVKTSRALSVPNDVSDRFHKTAPTYDAEVEMAEKVMGLGRKRRELVQRARGNVLEVACGTGRNMEYYSLGEKRGGDKKSGKAEIQGCRSVTFVDQSQEMVQIAKEKFEKMYPHFKLVAFRTQDAMDPIPPPPHTATSAPETTPGHPYQFDTVIQTMGLCSHPDPVSYLIHLGTLVKPERGEILLLEHGRSHYLWVNKLLDDLAPAHADRHGCWWNRDIGEVVRRSGLEIVESKRWHLGTTWKFVLRSKKGGQNGSGVVGEEGEEGLIDGKKESRRRWLGWGAKEP